MPLTKKQREAVEALAKYGNVTAAAKVLGIGHTTLYNWRKEPEFNAALLEVQRESLQGAVRLLAHKSQRAVEVLVEEMEMVRGDRGRVAAASKVLEHAWRAAEFITLVEEMNLLKAQVAELRQNAGVVDV